MSVEDFKRFFVYNFNFFYQVFAIKTSNNYTISHSYVVHVFLFIYLLFIIFFECEWSLQLTFIITKEIFFFFDYINGKNSNKTHTKLILSHVWSVRYFSTTKIPETYIHT